jgi:hypothetical protein
LCSGQITLAAPIERPLFLSRASVSRKWLPLRGLDVVGFRVWWSDAALDDWRDTYPPKAWKAVALSPELRGQTVISLAFIVVIRRSQDDVIGGRYHARKMLQFCKKHVSFQKAW